jgi:hypothetical protein
MIPNDHIPILPPRPDPGHACAPKPTRFLLWTRIYQLPQQLPVPATTIHPKRRACTETVLDPVGSFTHRLLHSGNHASNERGAHNEAPMLGHRGQRAVLAARGDGDPATVPGEEPSLES